MHEWERKREFSLGTRILLQVLRFALAALFFYIAYLGIIWRTTPAPPLPQAQKKVQPAAPAKPAPPAQAASPAPPAPKEPAPPAPKEPPA